MSLFQNLFSIKQNQSLIAKRWAAFQNFKFDIAKTGKKIDKMVYELYGLNEDEIAIVEGNVQ